jgi:penicillin-binding protein 1A
MLRLGAGPKRHIAPKVTSGGWPQTSHRAESDIRGLAPNVAIGKSYIGGQPPDVAKSPKWADLGWDRGCSGIHVASLNWQPRPWHFRAGAIVALAFLAVYGWFVVGLLSDVPTKKELGAFSNMASANILFDAADREVFTIAKEHRIEVPLADISPNLIKAVIAVEDRRFFEHDGFDLIRIFGAALAVVREGDPVQGASTITQQLARQSVGREKTLHRKLRELLFAAQLEHHFTKEEILELYLNKVYFGSGLYGVEAASRGYFGKKASELSLGEASLLAGLLKAPSSYDPSTAPQKAEARQAVVLRAMLDSKAITQEEYDKAF